MSVWKKYLSACAMLIVVAVFAAPVAAQDERQAELEAQKVAEEAERDMLEAERQLEEAARRIAELSSAELARVVEIESHWVIENSRPVLGINIGSESDSDPVEGVGVIGITPGGAAEEAGMRAGDIITAINGESLSSGTSYESNRLLLEFMNGVEEGDVLDVEYLRAGKTGSV